MTAPKRLGFTLLENGLDFIHSGLEKLSEEPPSKRAIKYAVLHLSAGIELVLKEALRSEHWALVFEEPNQANRADYESGEFVSVSLKSALERLAGICSHEFSDKDQRILHNLRRRRNRLEHFGAADSFEATVASSVEALEVILTFIVDQIDESSIEPEEASLLDAIRTKVGELESFVTKRLKSIEAGLKGERRTVATCPICGQGALALDDNVECHFCGYKADADDAAEEYATRILGESRYRVSKDGGEWPVEMCPECDRDALVDTGNVGDATPAIQYICFACGGEWKDGGVSRCSRCNRLMDSGDEDIGICSDCFSAMVNRDD